MVVLSDFDTNRCQLLMLDTKTIQERSSIGSVGAPEEGERGAADIVHMSSVVGDGGLGQDGGALAKFVRECVPATI